MSTTMGQSNMGGSMGGSQTTTGDSQMGSGGGKMSTGMGGSHEEPQTTQNNHRLHRSISV